MTDDLPPIAVAPVAEQGPPQAKRGRGRPPALNADGTRKNPARKSGDRAPRRERTATAATPAPRSASRKTKIADALADVSGIMMMLPPTRQDALSARENELLADALDKECKRSPRMAKVVDRALAAKGTAGIVGVVAIIAARRAGRHKLIPGPYGEFVDPLLGGIIHDDGTPGNPIVAAVASSDFAASILERAQAVEERAAAVAPEPVADDLPPFGAPGLPVEQPTNGVATYSFEELESQSYPVK